MSRPLLFEKLPQLARHLEPLSLGEWPTPIECYDARASLPRIYMKREDLASRIYGGNKLRAVEWLLADAMRQGKRALLTVGGIGSNQVLALARHGITRGFTVRAAVVQQPLNEIVLANLRATLGAGALLRSCRTPLGVPCALAAHALESWRRDGRGGVLPYLIPPGGASPVGMLGYVESALEIRAQCDRGELPPPDYIYCPAGSCATLTGLAAGCAIAGLASQVVAVRVAHKLASVRVRRHLLARRLRRYLSRHGSWRGAVTTAPLLLHEHAGDRYGAATREGEEARTLLRGAGGPDLETTYSAKAFAGALHFIRSNQLESKTHLFLQTWGGLPSALDGDVRIPAPFQHFFARLG